MSQRAKLFQSGGSQALRLPKAFRFEGQTEVRISRQGRRVIVEPVPRAWSEDFLGLAGAAPSFPYPAEPGPVDAGPDLDPPARTGR